jgi:hypothetical protein
LHHILSDNQSSEINPIESRISSGLLSMLALAIQQQASGGSSSASAVQTASWDHAMQMPMLNDCDRDNITRTLPHLILVNPISNQLYEASASTSTVAAAATGLSMDTSSSAHANQGEVSEVKDSSTALIPPSSRPSSAQLMPRPPVSWTVEVPSSSSSSSFTPHPPTLPSSRPRSASRNKLSLNDAIAKHQPVHDSSKANEEMSLASKISADSHQQPISKGRSAPTAPIKPSRPPESEDVGKVWEGQEVFLSDCPLRCSAIISTSRSTSRLAIGSNAKSVHLLDILQGQPSSAQIIQEQTDIHKGSIYAMDYASAPSLLATGSNDKSLRLWK